MRRPFLATSACAVLWTALAALPAFGWSSATHVALAEQAARFAPADLSRQLDRHPLDLRRGVLAAANEAEHRRRPPERVAADAAAAIVAAIEAHEPFPVILQRAGEALYWVTLSSDPLAAAEDRTPRYATDFERYVDSARDRFAVAFYGTGRDATTAGAFAALAAAARARASGHTPAIEREYERIGYGSGIALFDDRSTAFGVAALCYSHAVSDAIATLRYIWLAAGGVDRRQLPRLTPP